MPYLLHLVGAEPIEANSIASKAENFASFAHCTDAIYRVLRSSIFVDSAVGTHRVCPNLTYLLRLRV